MKQSLLIPMRVRSENHYRRGNPIVHNAMRKKAAGDLRLILDAELSRPAHWCTTAVVVRFQVTLCRISAGILDDDNLRGAFKGVRDTVARWLQLDDADPRIAFAYAQERGPRGLSAIRITIDDGRPEGGDHARDLVARSGLAPRLTRHPKQLRLAPPAVRRSFVSLSLEAELAELPGLAGVADPPPIVRAQLDGQVLELRRDGTAIDPDLGEGHLYRPTSTATPGRTTHTETP